MTAATQRSEVPVTAELVHAILLKTGGWQGADLRVLLYYLTAAPIGGIVRETGKEIAHKLMLSEGNVSKSIKRLRDGEWITLAYSVGNVRFHKVGPQTLALTGAPAPAEQPMAEVHHLSLHRSRERG
ncbi:hypothetical protein [Streptomyces alkaliphilus]|uniref:hypothetical protein n=1 Tax=Streptomyces alkaliphilus TaxID=1472722 RepID=UPI00117FFB03|nr:hypothetical protein [Streptomyces alkaliphilus]MQS06128.1 hypothetical protein [Streptomyces alkaliphilus]